MGEVLTELLRPQHHSRALPRPRSAEVVLEEGVAYLDYGDPDHVFRVSVTAIAPQRLAVPRGVVCEIDGVGVRIVEVTIGNDVHVVIDGQPGPVYEQTLQEYQGAHEEWERLVNDEGTSGHHPPPQWPGDRLIGCLRLRDNQGTAYRLSSGEAGGQGTEWSCTHIFRPLPAPTVQALRLEFIDRGGVVGQVILGLREPTEQ